MNVTLDIYDFASKDEIKIIILDEIRNIISEKYSNEKELDRLLMNLSYRYVFEMVDKQIGGNLAEIITEKAISIIGKLSSFEVFRRPDRWEEKSTAYKILEEELVLSRPIIKARIEQIIKEYPFHELDETEIVDVINVCIAKKLFGREDEK